VCVSPAWSISEFLVPFWSWGILTWIVKVWEKNGKNSHNVRSPTFLDNFQKNIEENIKVKIWVPFPFGQSLRIEHRCDRRTRVVLNPKLDSRSFKFPWSSGHFNFVVLRCLALMIHICQCICTFLRWSRMQKLFFPLVTGDFQRAYADFSRIQSSCSHWVRLNFGHTLYVECDWILVTLSMLSATEFWSHCLCWVRLNFIQCIEF